MTEPRPSSASRVLSGITIAGLLAAAALGLSLLLHREPYRGGVWIYVRHESARLDRNVILSECMDAPHLVRAMRSGDHIYRDCRRGKDGFYRWGAPLPNAEFGFKPEPRDIALYAHRFLITSNLSTCAYDDHGLGCCYFAVARGEVRCTKGAR